MNSPRTTPAWTNFWPSLLSAPTYCADEMIVDDLDASLLSKARSHPNYTLRTRRPELFGELVRERDLLA